ncbi:MAG: PASTA domain-containing protein [Oscillospiraceae bacterium]|nr:PASTA domain-containing protein [Oscillospiraceae bacterium]
MELKRICINCMTPLEPDSVVCPACDCLQTRAAAPGELQPGTVLQERYFVGKSICSNGEGITYSAYDLVSEVRVELREFFPANLCTRDRDSSKVLPNAGTESRYKALLLDFVDLAKVLTRSRSLTAVIPVQDMFEENNTVYTVNPYVETITLKDYLLRMGGELPWETCKSMFAPVISALNTIHTTVSQYHLGISPETILVDKNEQLRLSGFSIEALRVAKSDIIPELASGYAAPEQYNSANWIGPWTDVYALAAVMYKCVTGTMPPESSSRVMGETLLPANKLVKNIPINISNILFKAMNISPEKRTQSVEDLIVSFSEKAEFEDPVVTPQKKKNSKMIYVWIGIIAVCLVAMVALGLKLLPMIMGEGPSGESSSGYLEFSSATSEPVSDEVGSEVSSTPVDTKLEDYVGKLYNEIKEDLAKLGKVEVEEVFDDEVKKGEIMEQSPAAGEELGDEGIIKLTVSKGPEFYDYAALIGNKRTLVFVNATLSSLGIDPTRITVEYDDTTDKDLDGTVSRIESLDEGKIALTTEDPIVIYVSRYTEETSEESSEGTSEPGSEDASSLPPDESESEDPAEPID